MAESQTEVDVTKREVKLRRSEWGIVAEVLTAGDGR